MQVYKAFCKIINRIKGLLLLYIGIFLFFAVFLSSIGGSQVSGFAETKCSIAVINEDAGGAASRGLVEYLGQKASIADIEDDQEKLQDALFFRDIEYILRIPEGFSEGLLNGEKMLIQKTAVPDSTSAVYLDMLVNKYINTFALYAANTDLDASEITVNTAADLEKETSVEMGEYEKKSTAAENCTLYFNYLAYSSFAILVLGLGEVIQIFNQTDLKRRNQCSPTRLRSMNMQILFGCLSLAFLTWLFLIVTSFIKYTDFMLTINGALMLANSFTFVVAALSISFLIANLLKSRNALSAAANVVTLGSCFISGVFVPQELLGDKVLTIASFTPTYWFVRNNSAIAGLIGRSYEDVLPILLNMLIILGFAAASLAISLVIIKQRRVSA